MGKVVLLQMFQVKQNTQVKCTYCDSNSHNLGDCKGILKFNLKDRYEHLMSKGLCMGCQNDEGGQTSACKKLLFEC